MQCPRDACEAAQKILEMTKPIKGGYKGYSPGHVLLALYFLAKEPLGRPNLSKLLSLGEASSKSLLRTLQKHGYTLSTPQGHVITDHGRKLIGALLSVLLFNNIYIKLFNNSNVNFQCSITCLEPPNNIIKVILIRDYLVKEGCREAIIGGYVQGKPHYPGLPPEIYAKLPRPNVNRGVNIVVPLQHKIASLSACIELLAESCKKK